MEMEGSDDDGAATAAADVNAPPFAAEGPLSKTKLNELIRSQKMRRVVKKKSGRNKSLAKW